MASKKQIDVQSTLQQAARSRALIGLEDVFQYEDRSGNVVFNCTLCDVKLPPSELIRHVTGDMHKTIYLKTHKLEMYEEIYQQSRTETHYGKLLELAINKIMLKMGGFHKYSNIEIVQRTHSNHMDINKQHNHPKNYMSKDSFGQDIPTIGSLQVIQAPKVQVTVCNEQHGLMKRTKSRRKDFDSQLIEVSINILVQHSEINVDFASKMTHDELRQLYAIALEKRALEKRIARLNRSAKIEGFNSHGEREELSDSYNVISREYSAVLSDVHRRLNKEVKAKRMVNLATTEKKKDDDDTTIMIDLTQGDTEAPPPRQISSSSNQQLLDYEKFAVKLPDNMDNILQQVSDWESDQKNLRYKDGGGSYQHQSKYQQQQGNYKYADEDTYAASSSNQNDNTQPLANHHSTLNMRPVQLSVIATTDEVDWKYNHEDSYQQQQVSSKDELLPIRTSSPIPRYKGGGGDGGGYDNPKTSTHPQYTAGDGGGYDNPKTSTQYTADNDGGGYDNPKTSTHHPQYTAGGGGYDNPKTSTQYTADNDGSGYDNPKTSKHHPQYTAGNGGGQCGRACMLDYESNQYWQDDDLPQNNDKEGTHQQQYNEDYYEQDYNYPYGGAREHNNNQPSTSYQAYEQRHADVVGDGKEYDCHDDKHQPTSYKYVHDVTLPTSSTYRQQQNEDVVVSTTRTTTVMAVHLKESLKLLKRKITMEANGRQLAVTNCHHHDNGNNLEQRRGGDDSEHVGDSVMVVNPAFSCRVNDDYKEKYAPPTTTYYRKTQQQQVGAVAPRKRKLNERGDDGQHLYNDDYDEQVGPKRRVVMIRKQPLLAIAPPKHLAATAHMIIPKKKVLLPTPRADHPPPPTSYKTPATRFPPRRLKSLIRAPILGNMGGSFPRPKPPPPRMLSVRPRMRRVLRPLMGPRFHHHHHHRVALLNRPPPPPQRRPAAAHMRSLMTTCKFRPLRPTGFPRFAHRAPMQRFPPPSQHVGW